MSVCACVCMRVHTLVCPSAFSLHSTAVDNLYQTCVVSTNYL